jgi:uncharacterized protein YegP (UPF0339 family)
MTKPDTWKIYKDTKGEWRWTRTAPNHEIVGASTEGYKNKSDCVENAERLGYVPPEDEVGAPGPEAY